MQTEEDQKEVIIKLSVSLLQVGSREDISYNECFNSIVIYDGIYILYIVYKLSFCMFRRVMQKVNYQTKVDNLFTGKKKINK